jgi:hypothetical protein
MKQAHAKEAMQKVALIGLTAVSLAQPLVAAQPQLQNPAIEEIQVTGQSASRLRTEIQRIEKGMFAMFNELNSTDDFDVNCRYQCEPAYLAKARAANVFDVLTFEGIELKDEADLLFENRVKTAQLNMEIRKLALEHPELATAMLDLEARKQSLVERERRVRKERGLLGLFKNIDKE